MQDLLRFSLAMAVAFFHYSHFATVTPYNQIPEGYLPPLHQYLSIAYQHGYQAVSIFFFLSGFIIFHITQHTHWSRPAVKLFLAKRIARIYPCHLLTLITVACILALSGNWGESSVIYQNNDWFDLTLNAMLLNGLGIYSPLSFNGPSWSLSVEMLCYTSFAMLALVNRSPLILFSAALLFTLIDQFAVSDASHNVLRNMTFFYLGAYWCSVGLDSFCTTKIKIFIGFAISIITLTVAIQLNPGLQKALIGLAVLPSLTAAIYGLDRESTFQNRPFKLLGAMSFSIYMWHFPIQLILITYMDSFTPLSYADTSFFLSFIMGTLFIAYISGKYIEPYLGKSLHETLTRL